MNKKYSDYIVYVDESGDHGMNNINKDYPIFVLVFCIFKKTDYLKTTNAIQQFKFNHFGHDMVILHESEIRRNKGDFKHLNKEQEQTFIKELGDIMEQQKFMVIASVINRDLCTINNLSL